MLEFDANNFISRISLPWMHDHEKFYINHEGIVVLKNHQNLKTLPFSKGNDLLFFSNEFQILRSINEHEYFNCPLISFQVKNTSDSIQSVEIIWTLDHESPYEIQNYIINYEKRREEHLVLKKTINRKNKKIKIKLNFGKILPKSRKSLKINLWFSKSIFDSLGYSGVGFIVDENDIQIISTILSLDLNYSNSINENGINFFQPILTVNKTKLNFKIENLRDYPIKVFFNLSKYLFGHLDRKLCTNILDIEELSNLVGYFPSSRRKIWISSNEDKMSILVSFYSRALNAQYVPFNKIDEYIIKFGKPEEIILFGDIDLDFKLIDIKIKIITGDFFQILNFLHEKHYEMKNKYIHKLFRQLPETFFSIFNQAVIYDIENVDMWRFIQIATYAKGKGASLFPLNFATKQSIINIIQNFNKSNIRELILDFSESFIEINNSDMLNILRLYRGSVFTIFTPNLVFPLELLSFFDETGRLNTIGTQFSIGRIWQQDLEYFIRILFNFMSNYHTIQKLNQVLLVSNPTGDLASSNEECQEIHNIFHKSNIKVVLLTNDDAKKHRIRTSMKDSTYIHITCHCEDLNNKKSLVFSDGHFFSNDFPKFNGNPVVFLNACHTIETKSDYGEIINALIKNGAAACILTTWPIDDGIAQLIGLEFCKSLLMSPIGIALRRAKYMGLQKSDFDDITSLAYILFGDPTFGFFNFYEYSLADIYASISEESWGTGDFKKAGETGKKSAVLLKKFSNELKYISKYDNENKKLWNWLCNIAEARHYANLADSSWCCAEYHEEIQQYEGSRKKYIESSKYYKITFEKFKSLKDKGYYEPEYFLSWHYYSKSRIYQLNELLNINKTEKINFNNSIDCINQAIKIIPNKYKIEKKWMQDEINCLITVERRYNSKLFMLINEICFEEWEEYIKNRYKKLIKNL